MNVDEIIIVEPDIKNYRIDTPLQISAYKTLCKKCLTWWRRHLILSRFTEQSTDCSLCKCERCGAITPTLFGKLYS